MNESFSFSSRETHNPGPDIHSGKTGHDLPVYEVAPLDPEVFAAFTGPDGGLTSICNLGDKFSASAMQVCLFQTKDRMFPNRKF